MMKAPTVTAILFICATINVPIALAQANSQAPKQDSRTQLSTTRQWMGDLDALLKHRTIRIGVPYSKTFFYSIKGAPYGSVLVQPEMESGRFPLVSNPPFWARSL